MFILQKAMSLFTPYRIKINVQHLGDQRVWQMIGDLLKFKIIIQRNQGFSWELDR